MFIDLISLDNLTTSFVTYVNTNSWWASLGRLKSPPSAYFRNLIAKSLTLISLDTSRGHVTEISNGQ
jgi:hypothetical protein